MISERILSMSEKDLITVIVPVYNVERYLDRCITSISNQDYRNLEIILVDDGSPDSSSSMCEAWANRDDRIVVIHKQNGGLSSARNTGINQAHGQWIAFIDSDDWVEPTYISTLYKLAISTNADLAMCSYYDGTDAKHPIAKLANSVQSGIQLFSENAYTADWHYRVAWNKLYAHTLCTADLFPTGKLHEDEFAFNKIMPSVHTVATTSIPLYHYEANPNGIMHSRYSLKKLDGTEATVERFEIAIANNWTDLYEPLAHNVITIAFPMAANGLFLRLFTKPAKNRLLSLVNRYCKAAQSCYEYLSVKTRSQSRMLASHPTLELFRIAIISRIKYNNNRILNALNKIFK